jgi:hypothetical protein
VPPPRIPMALFQTLFQRRLAVLFFQVRQQPVLILQRSRKGAYSLPTSQPVRCKMAILMSILGGTAYQSRMGRRLRICLKSPPKSDGGRLSSICSGEQTPRHAATRIREKTAGLYHYVLFILYRFWNPPFGGLGFCFVDGKLRKIA